MVKGVFWSDNLIIFIKTFFKSNIGYDYANKVFNAPARNDRMNTFCKRVTYLTPPALHHKGRYHSIPCTTTSYWYFLKLNEPHFYQRRYFCFSCHNCENFKTDPFTRKYSCTREDKAGAWKKQVFKGKKKKWSSS